MIVTAAESASRVGSRYVALFPSDAKRASPGVKGGAWKGRGISSLELYEDNRTIHFLTQ